MKPPVNGSAESSAPANQEISTEESADANVNNAAYSLEPNPQTPSIAVDSSPRRSDSLVSNLIYLITGGLLSSIAFIVMGRPSAAPITLHPPPTLAPTATAMPSPTAAPIRVFITGAVVDAGLYEVPAKSRVGDVIAQAGGLSPGADPALVNQAEVLYDGAQIHIPAPLKLEAINVDCNGEATVHSSEPQPPAGISGAPATAPFLANISESEGLVNINSASAAELETLPGVGANRAADIIAGRPYESIEDLQKVSGIGAKTLEKLRPLVTAE